MLTTCIIAFAILDALTPPASTTKDNYLCRHMARNFTDFYCPVVSKYDAETRGGERTVTYLHLYLSGYGKFAGAAARSETYSEEIKTTFVNCIPHNPASFWQMP